MTWGLKPNERKELDEAWDKLDTLDTLKLKPKLTKLDKERIRAANHHLTPANARHDIRRKIIKAAQLALLTGGALIEHGGTQTHNDIIQSIKAQGAHIYTHKGSAKELPLTDSAIRKHLEGWLPKGKPGRP